MIEPEVLRAELAAIAEASGREPLSPRPPCPVFRYLDPHLQARIDAAAERRKPITRANSAAAAAATPAQRRKA